MQRVGKRSATRRVSPGMASPFQEAQHREWPLPGSPGGSTSLSVRATVCGKIDDLGWFIVELTIRKQQTILLAQKTFSV